MLAADVEAFLLEINKKLKMRLRFPNEPGFVISFGEPGSPCPRYLGKLLSKEDLSLLENKIPGPEFRHEAEDVLDLRTLSAFKDKIQLVIDAGKRKSKLFKGRGKGDRNDDGMSHPVGMVAGVPKDSWSAQLEKTCLYLGLAKIENDPSLQGTNAKKPTSNSFHDNVVFISIDVEAYEHSRRTITEIGISTLDTDDLIDVVPGKGGAEWTKRMRSRHFRIKESSHLENHQFVTGCANRFEKRFGTSEWISIKEAPQVVASCFKYPFSALEHQSNSTKSNQREAGVKRNIVLVGHDVRADIDYLRSIGYNVGNVDNLLEAVDTADMDRAISNQRQSRNLGSIISELGGTPWNLHNAVSDAVNLDIHYVFQCRKRLFFSILFTATRSYLRLTEVHEISNWIGWGTKLCV